MEMVNSALAMAVAVTVVLGFMWSIFSYVILRPLNNAIVELREAIKEMRKEIKEDEEDRHKMELRMAEIDQRARAAHNRLDELKEFCRDKHNDFPKRKE